MDPRVQSVISVMERSISDKLSLVKLAKEVNLSAQRLSQLFNKETGQSPMEFLKMLRLRKAERLLTETRISIKELAYLIGAGDVSHFVREFKRTHGTTPSSYRATRGKVPE